MPIDARILQAIVAAQDAGRAAASAELESLQARLGVREQYDLSAGAVLHLLVSPNSVLGRDIAQTAKSLSPMCHVSLGDSRSEMLLIITGMSGRQDQCINIAAEEAALDVLRSRLGVEGYVTSIES